MASPDPIVVERQMYLDMLGWLVDDPSYSLGDLRNMTAGGANAHRAVESSTLSPKNPFLTDADAALIYATKVEDAAGIADKVVKGTALVNVKDYGALGNNAADDTAAITAAIAAAHAISGRLFFPKGTYLVSGSATIFTLPSGLEIFGSDATIKVKNANGPWTAIFSGGANILNGLHIHDLTIDGNATNNQPTAGDFASGNYTSAKRRVAIRADLGRNITIENCVFVDHDCTWVIVSSNSAKDVKIRSNQFYRIGNLVDSGLAHDHSTVYVDAVGFEVIDNTFSAYAEGLVTGTTSNGAISPIDTHGSGQRIRGNVIIGYVYGGQLSTSPTFSNIGIEWSNNTVINCGHGLHIVPYTQGASNIKIVNNTFLLDFLKFRTHPWQNGGCGIALHSADGGPLSHVDISDNTIVWKDAVHTGQSTIGIGSTANGIKWMRSEVGSTAVDEDIRIARNLIVGAPDNGIYARFSNINGLVIEGNVVENCASSALADAVYSVGVYVDYYTTVVAAYIRDNIVRDTQVVGNNPFGNTVPTINAGYSLWSAVGYFKEAAKNNIMSISASTFVKFTKEQNRAKYDPPTLRSGSNYVCHSVTRTPVAMVIDEAHFVPIQIGPGGITQVATEITVTAGGSTIETALYDDLMGRPNVRLHSLGVINSNLSSWRATPPSNFYVPEGVYWLAFLAKGGTPTINFTTGRNPLITNIPFGSLGAADITGIKVASISSLPSIAPATGHVFGQGPYFYVVGSA